MTFFAAVVIVVGGLALRASAGIISLDKGPEANLPNFLLRNRGFILIAYLYMYFAVIAALGNGYALWGVKGLVFLPVATWVLFQAIDIGVSLNRTMNESLLFNPIANLMLFAPAYVVITFSCMWLLVFHG